MIRIETTDIFTARAVYKTVSYCRQNNIPVLVRTNELYGSRKYIKNTKGYDLVVSLADCYVGCREQDEDFVRMLLAML